MTFRKPHSLLWAERNLQRLACCIDRWMGFRQLRRTYAANTGREPDLRNPRTFSEKLQWRKLNDRNPLFLAVTDKIAARAYVASVLGSHAATRLMPELIWTGGNADAIPLEKLGGGVAVKAAHASGWNRLILPDEKISTEDLVASCHNWLGSLYGVLRHEWAYRHIPRRILIERLLMREDGRRAYDLKIHFFGGEPVCIWFADDTGDRMRCDAFWPDWSKPTGQFAFASGAQTQSMGDEPRPPQLDEMISIGRKLAAGFDYVRVDFLLAENRFLIGELTLYTASGYGVFVSDEFDAHVGATWRLPEQNLADVPGSW